jgi:Dolichyl-phosphate-mannose-protein mannosyltransferase
MIAHWVDARRLRRTSARITAESRLRLQTLIFAGCFLVSFVFQAIATDPAISLYDEGIILFGARRVMDGDLIHRDFYSNYGPGQFYTIAALFKLFSPSILVERLWDDFVRSVSVGVIFLIVARSTRSVLAALGTAAVCMVWFEAFGYYGYPVFPALAAVLTGLLCLLSELGTGRSVWSLLAAGVCMGVAFLFRYDIGLFTAAVMAVLLGLHAAVQPFSARRLVREIVRCVGLFVAGFALVAVPLICTFIVQGAIGDLVFDVVTNPSRYYYDTRSLPFPGPRQVADDPLSGVVYIPLVLVAAVSGTLGRVLSNRLPQSPVQSPVGVTGIWPQIALTALTLLYFAKGFVRVSPVQMSMAIITALVLTCIAAARLEAQRAAVRVGLLAALGLTVGITLGLFLPEVAEAGREFRAITADDARATNDLPSPSIQTSCGTVAGVKRLACFVIGKDHLRALEFLKAHTRPGEYLYVGSGRHDKILMNDVALYFLANLRSATKWHQFDPGLQTSAGIQGEMIDELKRNRPSYVVLESHWDSVQEPNASAQSSGVVLLDDYIRQNFHMVATFGTISVLDHDESP